MKYGKRGSTPAEISLAKIEISFIFNIFDNLPTHDNIRQLDQVEGEGWVDKNAALRGWAFFTSHGCKL